MNTLEGLKELPIDRDHAVSSLERQILFCALLESVPHQCYSQAVMM